jgi:hypothetical protein
MAIFHCEKITNHKKQNMKHAAILICSWMLYCNTTVAGNPPVKESGNSKSETRNVAAFDEISVRNAVKLILTQSDSYSVKVVADENVLPYVETKVSGSTLSIGMKETFEFNNYSTITVYVSFRQLNALQLFGASTVETTNGIESKSFRISSSGASKISMQIETTGLDVALNGASYATLTGKAAKATITVNGASDLKAQDFVMNDATVECMGASRANIYVRDSLDVHASGASSVKYSGPVKNITKDTNGVSTIKNAGS